MRPLLPSNSTLELELRLGRPPVRSCGRSDRAGRCSGCASRTARQRSSGGACQPRSRDRRDTALARPRRRRRRRWRRRRRRRRGRRRWWRRRWRWRWRRRRRSRVVVRDRAQPLAVGECRVRRVREIDEEGLVRPLRAVSPFTCHRDRLRRLAGREGEPAAPLVVVPAATAEPSAVAYRRSRSGRSAVQADREGRAIVPELPSVTVTSLTERPGGGSSSVIVPTPWPSSNRRVRWHWTG